MGIRTIEYVATFDLAGEHTFACKRLGGWFVDTLEVSIDHRQVLLTQAASWKFGTHLHHCTIDQRPAAVAWRWSPWRGDPLFIALIHDNQLLALYGSEKALRKAGAIPAQSGQTGPEKMTALRILREEIEQTYSEQVAQDEFPLDNSSGSDVLSVEYEVSKSLSASLNITTKEQLESHLKASLVTVLESQLAAHLSRETSHTIGETTTCRQNVRFSVKPGESVVYAVIWKVTVRKGNCDFAIDGVPLRIPYLIRYGLSFEVGSRPMVRPVNVLASANDARTATAGEA